MPKTRRTLTASDLPPLLGGKWAIREEDLQQKAMHMASMVANGLFWDDDEDEDEPLYYTSPDGKIAFIPVNGVLITESTWFSRYLGFCAYADLNASLQAAVDSETVERIRYLITSPGGHVDGVAECGDLIRDCPKPTEAYIQHTGCSGAMWLASQCQKMYCNRTAEVGSLATIRYIPDWSEYYKAMGVTIWPITSDGAEKYKSAGARGLPLTKEQQADEKRIVNATNTHFMQAVMAGRGWTPEETAARFDGRVFVGPEAQAMGMVDKVLSTAEIATYMAGIDIDCDDDSPPPATDPEDGDGDTEARSKTKPAHKAGFSIAIPQKLTAKTPVVPVPSPAAAKTAPTTMQPTETKPKHENAQTRDVHHSPALTGRAAQTAIEGNKMNPKDWVDKLIKSLTNHGQDKMAMSVLKSQSDEPDDVASTIAAQISKEVDARVAAHPLMMACTINGIKTVEQFEKAMEMKAEGEKFLKDLVAETCAEATRAYGAVTGAIVSANIEKHSPSVIKMYRDGWRAEADTRFGIGKDGTHATRQTAAPERHTAVTAEGKGEDKRSAWEKLTDEQRALAATMNFKTDAEKQLFANNLLALTAKEGE
jgi:ClpP class serine protease